MIALFCLCLALFASPFKSKGRLEAENAALRHQLIILRRKVRGRVRLTDGDHLFFIQLYRWRRGAKRSGERRQGAGVDYHGHWSKKSAFDAADKCKAAADAISRACRYRWRCRSPRFASTPCSASSGAARAKRRLTFAIEAERPRDCLKWWGVGIRLALVWCNDMTGRAPALREALAVISVRGEHRRHNEDRDKRKTMTKWPQQIVAKPFEPLRRRPVFVFHIGRSSVCETRLT